MRDCVHLDDDRCKLATYFTGTAIKVDAKKCEQCQVACETPTIEKPGKVVASLVLDVAVAAKNQSLMASMVPHIRHEETKMKPGCIYLGEVLSRPNNCQGCWSRRCDLYGVCAIGTPTDKAIRSCLNCHDYDNGERDQPTAVPPPKPPPQPPPAGAAAFIPITPETCPHRVATGSQTHACRLAGQLAKAKNTPPATTDAICRQCCQERIPPGGETQAVLSLALQAAFRVKPIDFSLVAALRARLRPLERDELEVVPQSEPRLASPKPATIKPSSAEWVVGMTVAPRRQPTLADSLRSVFQAGFATVNLFAEPETDLRCLAEFGDRVKVFQRSYPSGGAFPNFWMQIHELLCQHPKSPRFLLLQDDALFAPGDYASRVADAEFWKDPQFGMATLFASAAYDKMRDGKPWFKYRADKSLGETRWYWCGQAMAFSNESLHHFAFNKPAIEHRRYDRGGGVKRLDVLVGNWAKLHGKSIWICDPSIVKHVGETSTIWSDHNRCNGRRQCSTWAGETLPTAPKPTCEFSVLVPLMNRGRHAASLFADLAQWENTEVVVADFGSDDIDLSQYPVKVVKASLPFNRSKALNLAAKHASGKILFVCDADMIVGIQLQKTLRHRVQPGKAVFPTCWSLRQDGSGWWRETGYGMVAIQASDFHKHQLQWCEQTGQTWGKEDTLFFDACKKAGMECLRFKAEELVHRWHPTAERHKYHGAVQ